MFKISSLCRRRLNVKPVFALHYGSQALPQKDFLNNFTPIYKFPYIRVLSVINRLKLYQASFTVITIPVSLSLFEFNLIEMESVWMTICLGITGCITLFTIGIPANKFIGFIYLNKEENSVRVAFLDFWGHRRDKEVPLNDIVPFSLVPTSITDPLYSKFLTQSNQEYLKMNLKHGIILDKDKFDKVFAMY